jgi:IS30 family transposase
MTGKTPAQRRRDARMKEAVRLRAEGWSLRAIASHLNVDHTTVMADLVRSRRAVDSAGGNPPPGGEFPPPKSTTNIVRFPRRRAS